MDVRFVVMLGVATTLLAVGCAQPNKFSVVNRGTQPMIVQPEEPLADPRDDLHELPPAAWVLEPNAGADNTLARWGSVVHVFSGECVELAHFTLRSSLIGYTEYDVDDAGHITQISVTDFLSDQGASAAVHVRCPLPSP